MIEASLFRDLEFRKYRRGQDWSLWLLLTANGNHFEKFPGIHCTYTRRAGTLSSNKFRKLIDVWRIYREQEALMVPQALWRLMRHAQYVLMRPEQRNWDGQ
tara:strand:- start:214676 stop:214978 length:303 start_codon:yes stop_codon:yes gene_type:complete